MIVAKHENKALSICQLNCFWHRALDHQSSRESGGPDAAVHTPGPSAAASCVASPLLHPSLSPPPLAASSSINTTPGSARRPLPAHQPPPLQRRPPPAHTPLRTYRPSTCRLHRPCAGDTCKVCW